MRMGKRMGKALLTMASLARPHSRLREIDSLSRTVAAANNRMEFLRFSPVTAPEEASATEWLTTSTRRARHCHSGRAATRIWVR